WLFKPAYVEFLERAGLHQRLFPRVRAICIDEKINLSADRFSGSRDTLPVNLCVTADFHFHSWNPLLYPAAKLILQLFVRIICESAAAIDWQSLADLTE